jgi:hypothetical protein
METETGAGALVAPERCTTRNVRTAGRTARYRSSPPRAGRYIAGIASRSIALRESSEQELKYAARTTGPNSLQCPGFSGLHFFCSPHFTQPSMRLPYAYEKISLRLDFFRPVRPYQFAQVLLAAPCSIQFVKQGCGPAGTRRRPFPPIAAQNKISGNSFFRTAQKRGGYQALK